MLLEVGLQMMGGSLLVGVHVVQAEGNDLHAPLLELVMDLADSACNAESILAPGE